MNQLAMHSHSRGWMHEHVCSRYSHSIQIIIPSFDSLVVDQMHVDNTRTIRLHTALVHCRLVHALMQAERTICQCPAAPMLEDDKVCVVRSDFFIHLYSTIVLRGFFVVIARLFLLLLFICRKMCTSNKCSIMHFSFTLPNYIHMTGAWQVGTTFAKTTRQYIDTGQRWSAGTVINFNVNEWPSDAVKLHTTQYFTINRLRGGEQERWKRCMLIHYPHWRHYVSQRKRAQSWCIV